VAKAFPSVPTAGLNRHPRNVSSAAAVKAELGELTTETLSALPCGPIVPINSTLPTDPMLSGFGHLSHPG
jgi:hypothetical protein